MIVMPRLQPRRCPEPGRPFVNRERELMLIQNKVDIGIRGEPMPSVVTCFWGAFGMGKSWLLLEIERRYRHSGLRDSSAHPTIIARLDLNQELVPARWRENPPKLNREQLIKELWKQLASQLGTQTPDLGQVSAEQWAEDFVATVTGWSSKSTPMILLDTMDDLVKLDEQGFFWLEQHLVERLALTGRVLFVLTSRGELRRWARFQVRQRVDMHRLTAFDAKTAGKEVSASPPVSQALYYHAFGHPLITEHLGTALEGQGINLQKKGEAAGLIERPLVQTILEQVIDQILEPVELEPIPDLVKITKYASVLRWVSVEPLRSLAEGLDLVKQGHGDAHYLDLIKQLQAHHLLYWNSTQKSYEFDPVLRLLLTHFLEMDEPERFRAAHLTAFNFHCKHLGQYPQYLARYVPELIYHRTVLDRCKPLEAHPPTVQAWWEQFQAKEAPSISSEPWKELLAALAQDGELRKMLPAKEYERLFSETKTRAASASDQPRR